MLPDIKRPGGIGKTVQVQFGGLDLRPGAADGTFQYMEGLAADRHPIVETRDNRTFLQMLQTQNIALLGLGNVLIRIEDGVIYYNGILIAYLSRQANSKPVAFGEQVIETVLRELIHTEYNYKGACAGTANLPAQANEGDAWSVREGESGYDRFRVYVFESGEWVDHGRIVEPLEASITEWMVFRDGTYQGVSARANTLEINPNVYALQDQGLLDYTIPKLNDLFRAGDAVRIRGSHEENNLTLVVREVTERELRFYENSFRAYIGRHTVGENGITQGNLYECTGWFRADKGVSGESAPKIYFIPPSGINLIKGDYVEYKYDDSWMNPMSHVYMPAVMHFYKADGTEVTALTDVEPTSSYNHSTYPNGPKTLEFEATEQNSLEFWDPAVTISRVWPELDGVFAHNNRLWGWKGKELRCSKLGDPKNWEAFDGLSTDCWSLDTQRPEAITGGISLHGYPTFYTENRRYMIYGTEPSGFQLSELDCFGVREGCGGSMAVVDGVLYYVSRKGVMADAGSVPTCVSEALGKLRLIQAIGASFEKEYWVSGVIENSDGGFTGGDPAIFVLDTNTGEWFHDSKLACSALASAIGTLVGCWLLDDSGQNDSYQIACLRGNWPLNYSGQEAYHSSELVTNDYTLQQPNRKRVHRVQIRVRVSGMTQQSLGVSIMYDSSDTWETLYVIHPKGSTMNKKESFYIPVLPRRCDHFRLRFSGDAHWAIESLALELRQGSAIF